MSQTLTLRRLMKATFDEKDTVGLFFSRLKQLCTEYTITGGSITDHEILSHVLAVLPERFYSNTNVLETTEKLTIKKVKNNLKDFEEKLAAPSAKNASIK